MPVRHSAIVSTRRGLHGATIVFILLVASLAAVTIGGRMAGSSNADPADPPQEIAATDDDMTLAFQGDNQREAPGDPAGQPDADSMPDVSAEAMIALNATTGEVVHAANADEPRDVGSTVKIVTALVVMDVASLDDAVTVTDDDLVDPMVFSNMALEVGDTLTVEQLLQGLLIPSGSDGAKALARYVGGLIDPETDDPVAVFVDAMNDKAAALGMVNTVFANPHGGDADGAHSSARDLAISAEALLANPVLADIVAMPGYSFTSVGPEARNYSAQSTNELLTAGDPGILGVKSGSTENAGGCLVLAFEGEDGERMILVTLGSDLVYENGWITVDARWDDARSLVAWLEDHEP